MTQVGRSGNVGPQRCPFRGVPLYSCCYGDAYFYVNFSSLNYPTLNDESLGLMVDFIKMTKV